MKVNRFIAVILTLALALIMLTVSSSAMTLEEALVAEKNIPGNIGEETPSKVPTGEVSVPYNSSESEGKLYLLCGRYRNCSFIPDNKGCVAITEEWGERQIRGDKLRPGWKCVNKNGVDFETEKVESEFDVHSTYLGTHPLERLMSFDVFSGTITFGELNIIYKQNSSANAKNKSGIPYDIIVDIEIYDNVSDAELGAVQLENHNNYIPSQKLEIFDSVNAVDFEFTMPANVYQVLGNSTGVSISGKTLKLDVSKIMNNKGGVYRFASCELASNASKYETPVNSDNGSVNCGNVNDERPTAFYDVFANAYYVDAVKWAVEQGITSGTTTTTFSPNNTCTTAQILTFLWRANGSTEPTISNPFTNLQTGKYYTKAALWAYEKRLISSTTFGADIPCTRSMVVTYLWKLAGSPNAGKSSFTDVPTSADYAQAVSWAVGEGITSGTGNNLFSPDTICTRGQIATFLYRDFSN